MPAPSRPRVPATRASSGKRSSVVIIAFSVALRLPWQAPFPCERIRLPRVGDFGYLDSAVAAVAISEATAWGCDT